jgi:hypothetical protein
MEKQTMERLTVIKPDIFRKDVWRQRGEILKPVIKHWVVKPQRTVKIHIDSEFWQKRKVETSFSVAEFKKRAWQDGDSFIIDFGETIVGRIKLNMRPVKTAHNDAPIRLRLIAGELPYEVDNDPDTYSGGLSRAWLQDEIINFDNIPAEYILPRRYSLRYLKFELLSVPRCRLNFKEIEIIAEGVEDHIPEPLVGWDQQLVAIDNAGLRTLRNCMQEFFEDGPKRDRRLWLGDLRLQALVNSVSYKRFDQVERSIWLLASAVFEDGMIPGAIMLFQDPSGSSRVIDYALLFAPLLLEHVKFSGNLEIGRELFELAVHQFSFLRPYIDQNYILRDPGKWWTFIDHCKLLDREMPLQGVYIYSLKALIELAGLLGGDERAKQWQKEVAAMSDAVRKYYFDPKSCMIFSGSGKQKSSASIAWMIIAGVLIPEEGKIALRTLENTTEAILPNSPYLQHYVLNAYFLCGENAKAEAIIRSYWGAMVDYGADAFWEIFRPGEDFFSPYGDVRNNSSCHAWSCTPSYFLRNYKSYSI